ncbi:hypothetical protein OSTOST_08630 [Ostertagia ostertagi]
MSDLEYDRLKEILMDDDHASNGQLLDDSLEEQRSPAKRKRVRGRTSRKSLQSEAPFSRIQLIIVLLRLVIGDVLWRKPGGIRAESSSFQIEVPTRSVDKSWNEFAGQMGYRLHRRTLSPVHVSTTINRYTRVTHTVYEKNARDEQQEVTYRHARKASLQPDEVRNEEWPSIGQRTYTCYAFLWWTGKNEMAKSRARTRPYNLRPRTPKSDAQEVNTATVVSNARRLTPKWFLFHIMILSLIQVCSGCATPPGGLVCAKKGFYYITTAPQALDTCANGLKNTQNIHRCVHLVEIQTELFFKEKLFLQYIASDSCANFHVNNKSASLFQKNLGASIGLRILTIIWLALSIYLPMANSLCIIQARRKKLPHNVNEVENLKQQLHQTQRSLHQLKRAIPPLPEPGVLYDKIVVLCTDHYTHTQAVTSIEEKVRRLRSSDKSSQQRISEISSLNLEIDYLYLQFRFCRSQLLTFFSLPPLLIAMDKMTKQYWETLMSQPQEVSHNKALIMDMDSLEDITSDQLQMLSSLRSSLNDLRIEAQNDTEKEQLTFEKEVRDRLDQIQKLALGLQDAVMNPLREKAVAANQEAGEGIRRIREENDV